MRALPTPLGILAVLLGSVICAAQGPATTASSITFDGVPTAIVRSANALLAGTELSGMVKVDPVSGKAGTVPGCKALAGTRIVAVAAGPNSVWIATARGLFRADPDLAQCTAAAGAKGKGDKEITALAIAHGKLWVGTTTGLFLHDPQTGQAVTGEANRGELKSTVRAIISLRKEVWVGHDDGFYRTDRTGNVLDRTPFGEETGGRGITCGAAGNRSVWLGTRTGLLRYALDKKTWSTYTADDGMADNMVTAVVCDGRYVWVATLAGLCRFDSESELWQTYESVEALGGRGVYALAVDGDQLWAGTDDPGAVVLEKQVPQCRIDTVVEVGGTYHIVGTVADRDNQLYSIEYGPDMYPFVGFTDGVVLREHQVARAETLGVWTPTTAVDGDCLLRLRVVDKKGNVNEDYWPLVVDLRPPTVTIDSIPPHSPSTTCRVVGAYYGQNVRDVLIDPGKVKAVVDQVGQKYAGTVSIVPGANEVSVEITDGRGRKARAMRTVVCDTVRPNLTLAPTPAFTNANVLRLEGTCFDNDGEHVTIEPSGITIPCGPGQTPLAADIHLAEGPNQIRVTARDRAGNTTVVTRTMVLDTVVPSLNVVAPAPYSKSPMLHLAGSFAEDNLKLLGRQPERTPAVIDTNSSTFRAGFALREGTNLVNLRIEDKAGNASQITFSVIGDFTPPVLGVADLPSRTDDEFVVVQGTFTDDNLDRIVAGNSDGVINARFRTFKVTVPLEHGRNEIKLTARDLAGNSANYSYVVFRNRPGEGTTVEVPRDEYLQTRERIAELELENRQLESRLSDSGISRAPLDDREVAALKREVHLLKKSNASLQDSAKLLRAGRTEVEADPEAVRFLPWCIQKGDTVYVGVVSAVFRAGPTITAEDRGRLSFETPLVVSGTVEYWTEVSTTDGRTGWIINKALKRGGRK